MITRTTCRVCDGSLESVLSLGDHYISNFIEPNGNDGIKAPLNLVLCKKCKLLQLQHTVPGDQMYLTYWYRSGTNKTMTEALTDIAYACETIVNLQSGDSVLDIGCNDGTLLSAYKTKDIFKIGFDPAQNLTQFSSKVANKIVTDFFDADTYFKDNELIKHKPKIITSIAMFYDLEDPKKFVSDIKKIMHPDGLWVIQMSYLPLMLKTNELGNICHEHLEYYSLQSLEYLLNLFNFEIIDSELNDVNGGSLRVYIKNKSNDVYLNDRLKELRKEEKRLKLDELQPYKDFALRVERIKNDVVSFIKNEVQNGKKIFVYGASTKGNTLLQYFGLNNNLLTKAAERNKDKWGKVTVGTHIPIISEAEARLLNPDYFLVLPWHFIDEFQDREKDYLQSGGRFIVPMPYFSLR